MDRPVGSVTYTPFLDERAGIVADVTVTRLAEDRFRVVTGAGFVASDEAWLRWHARREGLERLTLRDVSGDLATVGLWGPRARDILASTTVDDVGDLAIPFRRMARIGVAGAQVEVARISYAGELGWELSMANEDAVRVWDTLWAAGLPHGLEPFGYRALEMLRMEKGYRYFGVDMTMLETPDEAGLGQFVRRGPGGFVGRAALEARRASEPNGPARRLRTLVLTGDGYQPVYGGEAVSDGAKVVSRLRSVGYAPALERTVAFAYLARDAAAGDTFEVEVFDRTVPATVGPDVPFDPNGERMRG
jgi:glycine cleavage system aminomethyltransferase T